VQDRGKPFSYTEVEEIVTAQLGVRIPHAFARFAREPLASATLGQVHRSMLGSLLEMKHFVGGLLSRVNRIMDAVANAEIEMKVRVVDANAMVEGFQKIANHIPTGIVLAALIVGAALLMRGETTFRLFGYPCFAILSFLAAAAGGWGLLVTIFVQDRKKRKKTTIGLHCGRGRHAARPTKRSTARVRSAAPTRSSRR
jgi:hypothetical protein